MINVSITFEPPLEKVAQAYRNVDLKGFIEREVVTKLAFTIERFAKQVTPVKTGRLRASIGVSNPLGGANEAVAFVQTNVYYAIFVHEGTRYMRARPFMEWGANFGVQYFNGDIGPRLDDYIRQKLSSL